jgi:hypothetical protein
MLYLLFLSSLCFAQLANEYFPAQLGFTWKYLSIPLDSANNGINQLAFYRADSFANVENYQGKMANIILTKEGTLSSIPSQAYDDSLFCHFDGQHALEYSKISNEEALLQKLDSLEIDTSFSFVDFFASLENWYTVYRFDQTAYDQYSIFMIDTTLNNGIISIPLRFEYLGERQDDEVIETQIGTDYCKKFVVQKKVSMVIAPTIQIPIVVIEDSVWIAAGKWKLKVVTPSTFVDLSFFGSDPILVPGLTTEITEIITKMEEDVHLTSDMYLDQNYPNPFNPKTNIRFEIKESGFISLKVFDAIGNEIQTLVNRILPAGSHSLKFDAAGLTSGIYIYRLQAGDKIMTKKMILLR